MCEDVVTVAGQAAEPEGDGQGPTSANGGVLARAPLPRVGWWALSPYDSALSPWRAEDSCERSGSAKRTRPRRDRDRGLTGIPRLVNDALHGELRLMVSRQQAVFFVEYGHEPVHEAA